MNEYKRKNSFVKKEFKSNKGYADRPELFPATCASCGKACQVPFRPNGKKPVYCKECFAANNDSESAPRKEFSSRPSYKLEQRQKPEASHDVSDLKKQMEVLNTKLDKVIIMLAENTLATDQAFEKKKSLRKLVEKIDK